MQIKTTMSYCLTSVGNGYHQKEIVGAGDRMEEREPSWTADGIVNRCSHYGKQYGGSSKN